ncbi:MAG: tRNA (guanosine(37)-N1)-methyltransferase TrmD [Candidatus Babeliales bacterium]
MNISILSVFPELYNQFLKTSLIARAQEKGLIQVNLESFFSFVEPKERIDAPTFGPGAGMLIRPDVVEKAINKQEEQVGPAFKVFFSPQGQKVNQKVLKQLANILQQKKHVMFIAGRYEGMDARVEEHYADMTLSIGDFVVMGGDLPAMLVLEGFLRLIPQIVGKQESVEQESFYGPFVDYPEYTAPIEWKGLKVPDIVRSGNHAAIEQWRHEKAIKKTVKHHFNWLRNWPLDKQEKIQSKHFIPPHYIVLMHTDVLLPNDEVGTTSVTSMDIHDVARSAATYGIENYFLVTPLLDQQKIVNTLIDFWQKGAGKAYNIHRYQALQLVQMRNNLDEVIEVIRTKEGRDPLIITTSAREVEEKRAISYYDQSKIWQEDRPVLLLFGTGKGLAPQIIERSDYTLIPVEGFSDFNHLSVRSAIAIILDRWMGINIQP